MSEQASRLIDAILHAGLPWRRPIPQPNPVASSEQAGINMAVYLDDGRVFEYGVSSHDKAREHAAAIAKSGYRHTAEGEMEHYPPHRILKIKATGEGIGTMYPDTVRGT